jgi:hypothetical protein
LEGYCIALAKPKMKVIPTSFCDNIVNHETKYFVLRYLFHPHILIQINNGIVKFFTLMVEWTT